MSNKIISTIKGRVLSGNIFNVYPKEKKIKISLDVDFGKSLCLSFSRCVFEEEDLIKYAQPIFFNIEEDILGKRLIKIKARKEHNKEELASFLDNF
jgi:hypothetical protein